MQVVPRLTINTFDKLQQLKDDYNTAIQLHMIDDLLEIKPWSKPLDPKFQYRKKKTARITTLFPY